MAKIYDDFAKLVIERIHGVPYEEAIEREKDKEGCAIQVYNIDDYNEEDNYQKLLCIGNAEYTNSHYGEVYKWDKEDMSFCAINSIDEKAEFKEGGNSYLIGKVLGLPITIGRVMQALKNKIKELKTTSAPCLNERVHELRKVKTGFKKILSIWILTKENGQECTHLDQTEETILKLTELLI